MPLVFSEHVVATRDGDRMVLASEPDEVVVMGREALQRLRGSIEPSDTDHLIASRAVASKGRANAFAFNAQGDGIEAAWRLDPRLTAEEVDEMGHLIIRSHLWLYRALARAGVGLVVAVGLGPIEKRAMEEGTRRAVGDIQLGTSAPRELDRWLLQHLTFFTTLPLSRLLEHVLPDKLPMMQRRMPRLQHLLDALYAHPGA